MTEKERQLILQDLRAKLHHGVKILHQGWNYEWDQELSTLEKVTGIDDKFIYTKVIDTHNGEEYRDDKHTISLFEDKPYLFPLSSMTEEQKEELKDMNWSFDDSVINNVVEYLGNNRQFVTHFDCLALINWCDKNLFDCRGLIPMGLAKDATGLNIY